MILQLSSSTAAPTLKYDSRYNDMMTHVGGLIRITVSVDGEPTPSIQWLKDGVPLRERKWVMIDTTDFMTTLAVKRVTREDAGEYSLVAKNQFGTKDVTFILRVQGKTQLATWPQYLPEYFIFISLGNIKKM